MICLLVLPCCAFKTTLMGSIPTSSTIGVINEACTLSTCNRFEIYFAAHDSYAAFHEAMTFLERHSGLPQQVLRKNLFLLSGEDAIWHLMRVSGGLDSLVVGEGQILSQVSHLLYSAYRGKTID